MEKSGRKCAPNPILYLVNDLKQLLHAINSFKNKVFLKKIFKVLKQTTLFFSFGPGHL